jgi:hypothetical protein
MVRPVRGGENGPMRQGLLAAGFAIAAVPYSGFVAVSVRYALRSHEEGNLPSWYGWVTAAASLLVTGLFVGCAARALGYGPSWRRLFRVTAVSFPIVALISLGSPQLLVGMLVLLLAIWLLRQRAEPKATPKDAAN